MYILLDLQLNIYITMIYGTTNIKFIGLLLKCDVVDRKKPFYSIYSQLILETSCSVDWVVYFLMVRPSLTIEINADLLIVEVSRSR
jgi:hypothetical protein